jgi:hypothetical protein
MPDYSHIFFNKTPLQLRLIGARGGKNLRPQPARPPCLLQPSPAVPLLPVATEESTAHAVAALDARFPWLRRAEKRHSPKPASARSKGGGACRRQRTSRRRTAAFVRAQRANGRRNCGLSPARGFSVKMTLRKCTGSLQDHWRRLCDTCG